MYSIVLMDGKIVNIKATEVQDGERFYNDRELVAEINMDNVAGWIQTDYKVKSEDWE